MNISLSRLVLASALILPLTSHAQLGLPNLGLNKSSNAPAASGNLEGQQTQIVRSYVGANKEVLVANATMAVALGLKEAAATARATAGALGDGATQGNLADADKVAQDSSNAVAEEMAKSPKLDKAAKAKFSEGLKQLGKGVIKYVAMRTPVQNFSNGLASASPIELPKLQSGSYVVKTFPSGAKNLGSALKSAVDFAKSNDIPVPPDATQAMAAL
ncbi:hypothetical protein ACG0Z6_14095 [Roseateles sp. BYS180W]|uniref:Uncharacterized protein n=1 Tax=Roseateles rivi TaxID=3299028 RepID=A0ABW7FYI4_9BURK